MSTSEERRSKRAAWPVRIRRLLDEEGPGVEVELTAEERMALVWELTREAWALSGREIPTYLRSETPVRVIRKSRSDAS